MRCQSYVTRQATCALLNNKSAKMRHSFANNISLDRQMKQLARVAGVAMPVKVISRQSRPTQYEVTSDMRVT